jgi:hypothetical protein
MQTPAVGISLAGTRDITRKTRAFSGILFAPVRRISQRKKSKSSRSQTKPPFQILLACRGNRDSREIRKKFANHLCYLPPLFKKKKRILGLLLDKRLASNLASIFVSVDFLCSVLNWIDCLDNGINYELPFFTCDFHVWQVGHCFWGVIFTEFAHDADRNTGIVSWSLCKSEQQNPAEAAFLASLSEWLPAFTKRRAFLFLVSEHCLSPIATGLDDAVPLTILGQFWSVWLLLSRDRTSMSQFPEMARK